MELRAFLTNFNKVRTHRNLVDFMITSVIQNSNLYAGCYVILNVA